MTNQQNGSVRDIKKNGEWPADKVERRQVASLIPYARNSRTHSPEQVAQIAASIREWGFTVPILIDPQGGLIAGHGRLLAAQKLGLDEVPCMVADGWTETQKRAYVIADNRLAETSGWDMDMLAAELEELRLDEFDIDLVGFDQAALDEMFEGMGAAPDFAPGTEADQGKLDELAPKLVNCPHCGQEFDARGQV